VHAGKDDDPLIAAHDGIDVDGEVLPVLPDALKEQPDGVPALEVAPWGRLSGTLQSTPSSSTARMAGKAAERGRGTIGRYV
jgi:hypothetical protein